MLNSLKLNIKFKLNLYFGGVFELIWIKTNFLERSTPILLNNRLETPFRIRTKELQKDMKS
jgi:hypothetical protein